MSHKPARPNLSWQGGADNRPVQVADSRAPRPIVVALAGLLALAIAMGIGRFAFTPLLPMMLHDGLLDLPQASWLASANYLGYWLGAMGCALQPALWRRWGRRALEPTVMVRLGLAATVLLTLGMALPWPAAWPLWRGLAGVASALVFVYVSGWCLARLSELGAPALAGIIFVGPGLGIAVSGLAVTAMVTMELRATAGWACFALLALALMLLAWPRLQGPARAPASETTDDSPPPRGVIAALTLAYGLAGFGYIITATFLPVIARQALPGSVWLDLFWPLFGISVAAGALITVRMPARWGRLHLLTACHALQALGVMLGLWWPTLAGFAIGSVLLGLPFTAITLFAMQEARRLRPRNASSLIGLLTAAYGLGQILGPALVAWVLPHAQTVSQGFRWSLQTAAAGLVLGLVIYAALARKVTD